MPLQWIPALRAAAAQVFMIAVAAAGGFGFEQLQIPAPWLSGAMIATVVLCALKIAPVMLNPIRDLAMLLAGLSMGASVTPDTLGALTSYPVSLALLALCMLALMAASTVALTRICGWAPRDAFFASAPGALTAVLIIAADERADVARIAVVQIIRLFILVMVLPSIIAALEPIIVVKRSSAPALLTPLAFAILMLASLVGGAALQRLRVTAPTLMGAMLASGLLAGSGTVVGQVPPAVSAFGFVMIGCFIGQRFRNIEWSMLARCLPNSIVSMTVGLSIAGAFSALVALVSEIPFGSAIVAFAPGGIEAMTVLALSLGLDPVYVGVHHLARFLLVGVWVPLGLRVLPTVLHTRGRKREAESSLSG